jgi:hypothetical protein
VRAYQQAIFPKLQRGQDKPITAAVKRLQTKRRGESGDDGSE